jgi:hypothetical protein
MPRAFLFLIALTFLGFGTWGLLQPESLASAVGWTLEGANARVEVRAFYGGLELGIGIFLCGCALRRARVDLGLWAVAWMTGGAGLARGAGLLLDGREGWVMPGFVAVELLAAGLALALIGRGGARAA